VLPSRAIVAGLVTALLLGGCATLRAPRSTSPPPSGVQSSVVSLFLQAQVVLQEGLVAGNPDTRAERAAALLDVAIALEPESALLHRFLAGAWASKPDHERAIAAASRAVALDPTDAQSHYLLGTELRRAGRPSEAELHLREAAFRGVGGGDPSAPHRELVEVLRSLGREDDAVAACDGWIAALPQDPLPRTVKADYLWTIGRADEARAAAAAALLTDPRSARARGILEDYHRFDPLGEAEALEAALERHWSARDLHRRLSDVYRNAGRFDRSLDHLRYVGMLDEDGRDLLLQRAGLLTRMHRQAEAGELLLEALEDGEDPALRMALADALRSAGDPEAALAELGRVEPDDPAYWRAAWRRARIHLERGEHQRAGETVHSARQLVAPEILSGRSALLALGIEARIEQGDFEQADRLLEELRRLDEEEAHRLRRLSLRRSGALLEAIRLEEEAVEEAPSQPRRRIALAGLQAEAGEWERAIATYDEGLEIVRIRRDVQLTEADRGRAWSIREQARADTAWLLLRRSFVEKDAGDAGRSEASLREVLALYPDHAEALNALAYLWAEEGQNLEEAERMVHRALEQRPWSAAFQDTLGWVRYRQGRLEEALEILVKADSWLSGDPEIAGHVEEVRQAIEQRAETP